MFETVIPFEALFAVRLPGEGATVDATLPAAADSLEYYRFRPEPFSEYRFDIAGEGEADLLAGLYVGPWLVTTSDDDGAGDDPSITLTTGDLLTDVVIGVIYADKTPAPGAETGFGITATRLSGRAPEPQEDLLGDTFETEGYFIGLGDYSEGFQGGFDVDVSAYYLAGGVDAEFFLDSPGARDTRVSVFDADQRLLGTEAGQGSVLLTMTVPADGLYYMQVQGGSPGGDTDPAYTAGVRPIPADPEPDSPLEPVLLAVGESYRGQLTIGDDPDDVLQRDSDIFEVTLEAGRTYTVSVPEAERAGLFVGQNPDAPDFFEAGTLGPEGQSLTFVAPADGTYRVVLIDGVGYAVSVDYTLTVREVGAPEPDDHADTPEQATRIEADGRAEGTIDTAADIDSFVFEPDALGLGTGAIDLTIRAEPGEVFLAQAAGAAAAVQTDIEIGTSVRFFVDEAGAREIAFALRGSLADLDTQEAGPRGAGEVAPPPPATYEFALVPAPAPVVAQEDAETVALFYETTFGRVPDRPGLDFWLNGVAAGLPLIDVAAEFVRAPEFARQFGDLEGLDLETQAAELYRIVLGRDPDAGGLAFWTEVIAEAGVGSIVFEFARSPENLGGSPYVTSLREVATPDPAAGIDGAWAFVPGLEDPLLIG